MSLYDKVYKTPREPYRRIFSKAFNTSLVIHNQFNVIHNAMSAFLKHSSSWPCDFFFDTYLLPSSCFCKMNFSHQTTYQSSFHNPKDFSCLFFFFSLLLLDFSLVFKSYSYLYEHRNLANNFTLFWDFIHLWIWNYNV